MKQHEVFFFFLKQAVKGYCALIYLLDSMNTNPLKCLAPNLDTEKAFKHSRWKLSGGVFMLE